MTDLINLTPHEVRIYAPETPDRISGLDYAPVATIPAAGFQARLAEHLLTGAGYRAQNGDEHVEYVAYETYTDGGVRIPVVTVEYSAVEGLPAERDGVRLIVPLVTALAESHRADLLTPYHQVRNLTGTVVGCRALARAVTGGSGERG